MSKVVLTNFILPEGRHMMEYTNKYWKMIMPLVKKSLVKRFGKEETASIIQKTDVSYRDMLKRADDIGKDNPNILLQVAAKCDGESNPARIAASVMLPYFR